MNEAKKSFVFFDWYFGILVAILKLMIDFFFSIYIWWLIVSMMVGGGGDAYLQIGFVHAFRIAYRNEHYNGYLTYLFIAYCYLWARSL